MDGWYLFRTDADAHAHAIGTTQAKRDSSLADLHAVVEADGALGGGDAGMVHGRQKIKKPGAFWGTPGPLDLLRLVL